MPGKESLRLAQYYAHPRNAFWSILGELVGAKPDLSYQQRISILQSSGIAVWDVLKCCIRNSSLDTDIEKDTAITNDFAAFFTQHPHISHIFFNGTKAEEYYRKHVFAKLGNRHLVYRRLPSTSPAHASKSFQDKLADWKVIMTVPAPSNIPGTADLTVFR